MNEIQGYASDSTEPMEQEARRAGGDETVETSTSNSNSNSNPNPNSTSTSTSSSTSSSASNARPSTPKIPYPTTIKGYSYYRYVPLRLSDEERVLLKGNP